MKEFIYQIETLKMGIHFISFIIYLVAISWCAHRFHRKLKSKERKNKLKEKGDPVSGTHPDFEFEMKRFKRNSLLLIIALGILHEIITWAKLTNFGQDQNSSLMFQFYIPPICVASSILILLIIFWLKGKGGGVPNNRYVRRANPFRD